MIMNGNLDISFVVKFSFLFKTIVENVYFSRNILVCVQSLEKKEEFGVLFQIQKP